MQAKGYPDLATRRFLRAIYEHEAFNRRTSPPVFGIFDADPDGINIMQIYRQGSRSLPHERAFSIHEMQWLGVWTEDIFSGAQDDEPTLKLTPRDRRKAVAMMKTLDVQSVDRVDEQCRVELQKMLILNIKAEVQILEDRNGGLERWLRRKLKKQLSRGIGL